MSDWKLSDLKDFHDDAARAHDEYDALARDIVKTLPESEWPAWVHNRMRMWIWGNEKPITLPDPDNPDKPGDTFPEEWLSRVAAGLGIPADYTPDDPYDIGGKMPLINAMQVDWADMPPAQAEQVIVNAFRATMLSPRMNLKSNAILYQLLMDIPAHESDPDVFEQHIRQWKAKWDTQGQMEIGQDPGDVIDPNEILPGKFMPGFWGNIRRLAALGPYADTLYHIALDDVHNHGGSGEYFRDQVLKLGIPGVQAKVASFAWLALMPLSSELGTIDVHMMRHLGEDADSPRNTKHYLELENRLRNERDETYGTEVPLSHYQWAVWDARRTPGFHQDHTPLRAYQPTSFRDIAWPPTAPPSRTRQAPEMNPGQQSLLGSFEKEAATFPWSGSHAGIHNGTVSILRDAGVQARITFPPTSVHPQGATFTLPKENPFMYTMEEMYAENHPYPVQVETEDDPEYVKTLLDGADRGAYKLQQLEKMKPQGKTSGWKRIPIWTVISRGSYSLQGRVVADVPGLAAQGIAVRPDRQSQDEIMEIINNLSTHEQDYQKQRKLIPDWALNRGGRVGMRGYPDKTEVFGLFVSNVLRASGITRLNQTTNDWIFNWLLGQTHGDIPSDTTGKDYQRLVAQYAQRLRETTLGQQNQIPETDFRQHNLDRYFNGIRPRVSQDFRPGPGGVGVTHAPSVIAVTEWATPHENWLYEHNLCRGIIAEKGGGSSHAVVVARARNIAVVVDAPEAARIDPGDDVQMNSQTAIIYINGGTTEDFGEAEVATIPLIRFVWSKGHGLTAAIPQDDPESGTLHRDMIMQQFRAGQWDQVDNALGVVYADGKVDMLGQPSDQQEMLAWLNTIHPITNVTHGFSL